MWAPSEEVPLPHFLPHFQALFDVRKISRNSLLIMLPYFSTMMACGCSPVWTDRLAESRFEGDLTFDNGIATGCRIWARHVDFKGRNAVRNNNENFP